MNKLGLVSPWVDYYRKLEALFAEDPGVKVLLDNKNVAVKILVEDGAKAEALEALLPNEVTFGNVTVKVIVVPANPKLAAGKIDLVAKAFEGNDAVVGVFSIDRIFSNAMNYVVFKPKVVQYFNDDLSDAHGVRSTLYQELAKEVFGEDGGVFFCTDVVAEKNGRKVGMPLGEWP